MRSYGNQCIERTSVVRPRFRDAAAVAAAAVVVVIAAAAAAIRRDSAAHNDSVNDAAIRTHASTSSRGSNDSAVAAASTDGDAPRAPTPYAAPHAAASSATKPSPKSSSPPPPRRRGRDAPGEKVLKDRRSPRERGRMGTASAPPSSSSSSSSSALISSSSNAPTDATAAPRTHSLNDVSPTRRSHGDAPSASALAQRATSAAAARRVAVDGCAGCERYGPTTFAASQSAVDQSWTPLGPISLRTSSTSVSNGPRDSRRRRRPLDDDDDVFRAPPRGAAATPRAGTRTPPRSDPSERAPAMSTGRVVSERDRASRGTTRDGASFVAMTCRVGVAAKSVAGEATRATRRDAPRAGSSPRAYRRSTPLG
eukprot:30067-Pelagococcus_subviridis.AAC.6